MSTELDERSKAIRAAEHALAKRLAAAVIRPGPISVWEVMMPIIFILKFVRFRQSREVFILNALFTRNLALKAALDMAANDRPREAVISAIGAETDRILESDTEGVYSREIRRCQMIEIDILIDHYGRLLSGPGQDYASMLKDAYQSGRDYSTFLTRLAAAEKEVTLAAQQTLEATKDTGFIARMETSLERLRRAETEKIFGDPGRR